MSSGEKLKKRNETASVLGAVGLWQPWAGEGRGM